MEKKILINTIITLLILAGIVIIGSIFWQIKTQLTSPQPVSSDSNPSTSINTSGNPAENSGKPPIPPSIEPEYIDQHTGFIEEIQNNYLVISTIYGSKTVDIDNNTTFHKTFTKKPPIPGSGEIVNLPADETISWQDFAIDQKVTAESDKNIRGQTTFLATEINLVTDLDEQ